MSTTTVLSERGTRESVIGYLSSVTVAPITSTIRGVPSEVVLTEGEMKGRSAVKLHNAVFPTKAKLMGILLIIRDNLKTLLRPGSSFLRSNRQS